jgi:hypothetical protein
MVGGRFKYVLTLRTAGFYDLACNGILHFLILSRSDFDGPCDIADEDRLKTGCAASKHREVWEVLCESRKPLEIESAMKKNK